MCYSQYQPINMIFYFIWRIFYISHLFQGITDMISFLKAVRLLRLNRVVRALDQYLEYGFITLILWMLFFCLCAHWMACIFFAIADHYDNFADIGWVRAMSEQTNQPLVVVNGTVVQTPTLASLYMSSLYFSLTSLTSIGFGNIAPNTTAEKIFSCVTMIFGGTLKTLLKVFRTKNKLNKGHPLFIDLCYDQRRKLKLNEIYWYMIALY